jgi:hypothetical protein
MYTQRNNSGVFAVISYRFAIMNVIFLCSLINSAMQAGREQGPPVLKFIKIMPIVLKIL